jgi:two-component system osmolarity sensor histidine kinase EnvZ
LWLIGTSLLLGAIAIVFLRNQVRSILRLAAAAEAFGRGRDMPAFKPSGATEVRRAGRAFIAMRERIKRHIDQRTTMLAGVSHDLRTPLTRMKLALAMAPESAETQEVKRDVAEMERMINSYLEFASDNSTAGEPEAFDIAEIVREVAEDADPSGERVAASAESEVRFEGRRDAIKRAIANLVGNGLKYARRVEVSAERAGPFVAVTVDDDGPGIPEEKRRDVFKPFYRLDESRSASEGVGLGLSVVRDVARSHGGDVALSTSPLGGLRAVMKLPG